MHHRNFFEIFTWPNTNFTKLVLNHCYMINTTQCNSMHLTHETNKQTGQSNKQCS